MLCAIALTIFMVEAQIPPLTPIPGIKMGLANIVTVFTVFAISPKDAAAVLFVRIFLGAVFAGHFSTIFYSGAGGLCAIAVTILSRKILTKKQLWIAGVLGAIAHAVTHDIQFMNLAMSLFLCMFATERISCAIMTKSRGQWVFAGIVTVVAIAEVTVFLLKLFGVM